MFIYTGSTFQQAGVQIENVARICFTHCFVVAGAPPSFDGQRLLRDAQKICETAARLWHGARSKPPQPHYLFMLNATPGGYGGLEHRCCTAPSKIGRASCRERV